MSSDINQKDLEALKKARMWEDSASEEQMKLGWEWFDAGVMMGTVNRLIGLDLVQRTYHSRSAKHHKLTEKAKAIVDGDEGSVQVAREILEEPTQDIYTHMFDDIVGYDDIKELIREGLQLEKPIHVLLIGPPSIAKTMFLDDIERVFGEQAQWFLGSGTSRVGLWERISEKRPRIILIDEIDKMKSIDCAALLSLMQSGRVTITKHGKREDLMLDAWVIACANRASGLSPELISRFKRKDIREYTSAEFKEVVTHTLVLHEGVTQTDAYKIAMGLLGKTHNVRDAVRVARLSKRITIERAIELIVG